MYSASVDYDSDRRVTPGYGGSEASILTADLRFKRALEDWDFTIEPRYSFRRFTDAALGNGDDRSLAAGFDLLREHTTLNLTASYLDQSTLTTELLETGIIDGSVHQRQAQAGGNWIWTQTALRELITQLSYVDVSYYGDGHDQLPGYRYPSGSLGERFAFSERGNFTLSAFGSQLSSDTQGNSSHEVGLQAEVIYSFSERTHFDGSVGESSRELAGASSHGTDAAVSLTHDYTRGNVAFNYTRSLVPYGIGFLVERQQTSLGATRQLTPYLDGHFYLLRIDNNKNAVLLGLDRRSIDSVAASLDWHTAETWTVSLQISALHTQAPGDSNVTVNEWRSLVTLTWNPRQSARSW